MDFLGQSEQCLIITKISFGSFVIVLLFIVSACLASTKVRVQVANLHNVARALASKSRCF